MTDAGGFLPHNHDAEVAVLGAVLSDRAALFDVVAVLVPEDFFLEAHQTIWRCIQEKAAKGDHVDELTVIAALRAAGSLEAAGGATGISSLADAVPDVAGAVHYAGLVKAAAARRRMITLGRSMVAAANNPNGDSTDLVDGAMRQLLEIHQGVVSKDVRDAQEVAGAVADEALLLSRGVGVSKVLSTGLSVIDDRVFMRHGKMIVLGGTAGSGKTSLALQIADHVATSGKRVLFVSLEMSAEEIAERLLAARSGIPVHVLERGMIPADQFHYLASATEDIPKTLLIDDSPGTRPLDIRAEARNLQLRDGLDLVVVDYIQRLTPTTRGRSRENEVSEMSRELKLVARSLNIPVIVLSQLSRLHERERRKPQKSDFRESGAIEQDADVLLALYRERVAGPDGEDAMSNMTELLILKQRQGPTGVARLEFSPTKFHFKSGGY